MRRQHALSLGLGLALACGPGFSRAAAADEIKLKSGATVSGDVVKKDGENVFIRLSRDEVASVDGQALPPAVKVGASAPAFSVVDLNGVTHTMPDAEKRVTLVKFWATWCPHCRSDVQLMKDLTARYQDQGFQVLAISVDQDVDKLKAFVQDEQLAYPVIATRAPSVSPEQAAVPERYEAEGIPSYFLVDSAGKIVRTASGSFTEGKKDVDALITPLLVSTKPAASAKSKKP